MEKKETWKKCGNCRRTQKTHYDHLVYCLELDMYVRGDSTPCGVFEVQK